jgi:FdhD protein
LPAPLQRVPMLRATGSGASSGVRVLPEEVPVAFVYDGTTHAVMMASPADLEDFALGFSITEGKAARPADIAEIEIVEHASGIEARIWLAAAAGREDAARRRAMLGPTGCGLCGVESLAAALPEVPVVGGTLVLTPGQIASAVLSVRPAQVLNAEARALHAAGFWTPADGLVALREDVGRHNALDKLVGALVRGNADPAAGVVVLTSRLSVEMVQKAAALGAPVLAAVSAPTALALRTAVAAEITVVAVARDDGFEVFTRPDRIAGLAARQDGEALRAAG